MAALCRDLYSVFLRADDDPGLWDFACLRRAGYPLRPALAVGNGSAGDDRKRGHRGWDSPAHLCHRAQDAWLVGNDHPADRYRHDLPDGGVQLSLPLRTASELLDISAQPLLSLTHSGSAWDTPTYRAARDMDFCEGRHDNLAHHDTNVKSHYLHIVQLRLELNQ